MAREHVHILISPHMNPQVVYEEVVPVGHQEKRVIDYYGSRGWDVLVIPDEEVCGVISDVTKGPPS